jgi:hypothetical protein
VTIEIDDEVLIFSATFDGASDSLSRMIASGDADRVTGRIFDRLDLAFFVELKQVAVCCAGSHSLS